MRVWPGFRSEQAAGRPPRPEQLIARMAQVLSSKRLADSAPQNCFKSLCHRHLTPFCDRQIRTCVILAISCSGRGGRAAGRPALAAEASALCRRIPVASPFQRQARYRKLWYLGIILVLFTLGLIWRRIDTTVAGVPLRGINAQAANLAIREESRGEVDMTGSVV